VQLRPYQQNALDRIREAFRNKKNKVMVCSPTGSGKGVMLSSIINSAASKGTKVLFLVHRTEILFQVSDYMDHYAIPHGIIKAGEVYDPRHNVDLASVQTMVRRIKHKDFGHYDMVVVDEAHHSTAATYIEIIEKYAPKLLIGFSATPCRKSGMGLGALYNELIVVATMADLVDQGYLVPVRYFAPFEPDLKGIKITAGDYNEKQLSMAMMQGAITANIVEKWKQLGEGRQTVCFTTTVAHSVAVCERFRSEGIPAEHVDGATDSEERKEILRRYARGEFKILCNCAVFTEGVDIPSISCVIMARPTKSIVMYLQCVGRGMRLAEGKDDCIAAGTKILTQHGLIDIDKITLNHLVWDGVSFVPHKGAICKGVQNVITYAGLTATPDHRVKTEKGWRTLGECAAEQIPIVTTGFGGRPIRECENHFTRGEVEGQTMEPKAASVLSMRNVWARVLDSVVEPFRRKNQRLQSVQPACEIPEVAVREAQRGAAAVQKPKVRALRRLWGAWHRVQIRLSFRCLFVGEGQLGDSRTVPKHPDRQDRQQRPLRSWKHKVVNLFSEPFAYSQESDCPTLPQVQGTISRNQIRRFDTQNHAEPRHDICTDHRAVEPPVMQAQREVWDILDCGPRHCFTANGLLVHNCLLLDMAGVYWEHGPITEITNWTLNEKTKMVSAKNEKRKERNSRPITCLSCHNVYTGQLKCPRCGTIPVKERYGQDVEEIDAVLGEIVYKGGTGKDKTKKDRKPTMEEKQSWYSQLIQHGRNKGYRDGWAFHQYCEKFGVQPRGLDNTPKTITSTVQDWISYQNIKKAKDREKAQSMIGAHA